MGFQTQTAKDYSEKIWQANERWKEGEKQIWDEINTLHKWGYLRDQRKRIIKGLKY